MCFFFNVTATTESYTDGHTLSLHDAFPILGASAIDLLLATGLVFGLSIVGVAGWALVRGVRLGMADGAATDPQQVAAQLGQPQGTRSEEHTSELQSLMRISYAVFCLKKKTRMNQKQTQILNESKTRI